MSSRKKAVSSMLGGLAINAIKPYKNSSNVTFNTLDIKKSVTTNLSLIESTRDISDNNNIVNKTYFVKFDNTNKQILLSEDESTWFPAYKKIELYVDATYTFIQKDSAGYNNSTNPFLISSRNIYEKPRLFPLYDDNITYQVYNSSTSSWINKIGADPDGLARTNGYYTQPLTGNITKRRLIFSPSKHKVVYYITEQFTQPNITGGILNVNPNYYKYGAAIINSGAGIEKNVNVGKNFTIDDIFIVNNKNTVYTTDKVNSSFYYNDYYKICTGIGTNTPYSSLDMSAMKNAMLLPTGNNISEKPAGYRGMLRYNNEILDFEGKGTNEWGTIGGIQDIDMNTKIKLYPGKTSTDDLGTLTAQTENQTRYHISSFGIAVQHNKPNAMLDIKGNMIMTNHTSITNDVNNGTNVGGIITGADLTLSDNYLNVEIKSNTSDTSIDIKSNNGGMDVNIKKNQEEIVNLHKTTQVGQNLTETVSSYYKLICEKANTLTLDSSSKQTITGINQETYKNNYNDSIESFNLQINGDSVESFHSSVTTLNKNLDKTKTINNNHDLLIKFNSATSILNNNEIVIKNNLNETNNLENNFSISKNCNTSILGNYNLLINEDSIKEIGGNLSTQILKDNYTVCNSELVNDFHNNCDLHTKSNLVLNVKTNLDTYVTGNSAELIDSNEINMLQNQKIDVDTNKTTIVKLTSTIENKNNKTILNKNNKSKNINSDYNLAIDDNNVINHKKNSNITTTTDFSEMYKSTYSSTSTQPYLSNLGKTTTRTNQLNSSYANYNKTVNGVVSNLFKNNVTSQYHTTSNSLIKTDVAGTSNLTYKNDYDLKVNDTSSKTLNINNTVKVTTNCLETYIKNVTSTVKSSVSDTFKNNQTVMVNGKLYNNINVNSDTTTNNVTTILLKDNNDVKVNKLNTITKNKETVNYKKQQNSTIKGINTETYKSNYNVISKTYNLSFDSLVLNKHNTDTLTVHNHSTEVYSKNSSIKIESNKTSAITNNVTNSCRFNSNNTIDLDFDYLVKQSLTETIGTTSANDSHIKHIKQTKTTTIDNNVDETFSNNKNTVQNTFDINIATNKNRIRTINNTSNQTFDSNNIIKVESDNIETITGKLDNHTYNDFTIEEHYGEIQLNTK
tara:strand:- start:829 stop:4215 length:3387 start_codon:yes stop_codon:yes gene_type:complete